MHFRGQKKNNCFIEPLNCTIIYANIVCIIPQRDAKTLGGTDVKIASVTASQNEVITNCS